MPIELELVKPQSCEVWVEKILTNSVQQCFCIMVAISSSLERGQYYEGVFLDVPQAFDGVQHPDLVFKREQVLPNTYYFLKPYLEGGFF